MDGETNPGPGGTPPAAPAAPAAPAPAAPAPAAPAAPAEPAAPAAPVSTFGGLTGNEGDPASSFGGHVEGGEEPAPEVKPVDPASYQEFTFPEGTDKTTEGFKTALKAFTESAGKRGFDQRTAQGALDLMNEMKGVNEARVHDALVNREQAWAAMSKAQGLLTKATTDAADAGLTALDADGGLRKMFTEARLLAHPALIRAFAAFHKSNAAPEVLAGGVGGASQPDTFEEIMYPAKK